MIKNKNMHHSASHEAPSEPAPDDGRLEETTRKSGSFVGVLMNRAKLISANANLAALDAFGRAREWTSNNKTGLAAIGLGVVAVGFASRFGIMPWLDNDTDTIASVSDIHTGYNTPATVTFDDITPVNVSKPLHDSGNLPPAPLTSIEMGEFDTQTDPATGYLNGTLWKEMAEEAQARGIHLSDEQLDNLTSRALTNNGIDDATQLQIGQRLDISADIRQEMGDIGQPGGAPGGSGPAPGSPENTIPPTNSGPSPNPTPHEADHPVRTDGDTAPGLLNLSTREKIGVAYLSGIGLAGLYAGHRLRNRQNPPTPRRSTQPNPQNPDHSAPSPQQTPGSPNNPNSGNQPNSEPRGNLRGGIESGVLPDWPRNRQDGHINPGYYQNWSQRQLEARRAHYEIYRDRLEEENDPNTEETRRQLREQIDTLDRLLIDYGDQHLQASYEAKMTFANIPRKAGAAAHQIYDDTVEYLRDGSYRMGDEIMKFHSGRTSQEIGQERIRVMDELEEIMQPDSTSDVDPIKLVRKVAELDFVLARLAMPDPRSTP